MAGFLYCQYSLHIPCVSKCQTDETDDANYAKTVKLQDQLTSALGIFIFYVSLF